MINAEKLKEVGIDFESGLKRFMNDIELYEAVLNAFLSVDIRERAASAYEIGDTEALLRVVHETKGASGNADFTTLYKEASALVTLLRLEAYTQDELAEHYARFEKEYTKVYDGIKSAIQ